MTKRDALNKRDWARGQAEKIDDGTPEGLKAWRAAYAAIDAEFRTDMETATDEPPRSHNASEKRLRRLGVIS